MDKQLCVLPCNGLDKSLGVIARAVALNLIEKKLDLNLICPVLLNTGDEKYESNLRESRTIVIDGCMTRCATKLIEERNQKIYKRIFIPDMSKKLKIKPGTSLKLSENAKKLAEMIAKGFLEELKVSEKEDIVIVAKTERMDFFDITVDKFYFQVPKEGYFFNENDCWIKPDGDRALISITDYLQNQSSDIMFVELPKIGQEIEQFDDVGSFESVKTVLQLISPGSGKIVGVNKALEEHPEWMNQDCYQQGWFAELELKNFEEDKELLMDGPEYFEYMKEKILKERELLDKEKED